MAEDDDKVKKTGHKNQRSRRHRPKPSTAQPLQPTQGEEQKAKVEESDDDEEEGELCFICTEPVTTFAVAQCDHRTCHRCSLRLRALYETRNCAYCKAEQKVVIFTKDAEKSFDQYTEADTPFTDKKLGIKFETQEMYKDAKSMMDFNCPQKDCTESFKNWGELKFHVRKTHSLNICDLCSRHKKVFPYEHTLYTTAQLSKHHKEGDKEFNEEDETGFSGHPECAFCKIRFFGDDELFVHCRDMHEQCFICVRNGNRHQYYANYSSLEEHFRAEHSMCLHPQCLEKKFVVFDSPIDLKAHQVEVHGESVAGLQRSMQTDARKLEVNFQYESYRNQQQRERERGSGSSGSASGSNNNRSNNRNNNNNNNGKKKEDKKADSKAPSSAAAAPIPTASDFPTVGSTTNENLPRIVPGASTRKGKGKALNKPAGFGALSSTSTTPSTSSSTSQSLNASSSSTTTTSKTNPGPTPDSSVVLSHTAFLSKVENMLKSKEKVAEFRSLTGAYRKSNISGEDYVNKIVALTNHSIEHSAKIFKGVEDLLDIEDKKWELIRVWRNKQTTMNQFPALDKREKAAPPKSSRVLVIKGPNKPGAKGNSKANDVWDKVATAASVANAPSSKSSSPQNSARSSPQSSRPSSPSNSTFRTPSKTPWAGNSSGSTSEAKKVEDFPSLKPKAFPSLPVAPPKHQLILNMRRTASGQQLSNSWGGGGSSDEGGDSSAAEESSSSQVSGKKKGRKNKVLFRVGL